MRLDSYLCETGYTKSRTRAQKLIANGLVTINGIKAKKASQEYTGGEIVVAEGDMPFVSRGGLKLDSALACFGISVDGFVCCDIGASTGGFTDCMLKRGAKKVFAVDCGSGQLDESLLNDKRVINIENFNARYLTNSVIDTKCDMVTMDVSFISQTLIHPAVGNIIKTGGHFLSLIKPQFEVGRQGIGKGGIVKKQSFCDMAAERVKQSGAANGFRYIEICDSPILGGDGNKEFIAHFIYEGDGVRK
ncbi:MAG: TlyA family RNA methyltransferase [Clostridia bacterium]|nr:TlyA family RNA methyltransferase [Clostridia bacterium]